jgi:hypothetical protein
LVDIPNPCQSISKLVETEERCRIENRPDQRAVRPAKEEYATGEIADVPRLRVLILGCHGNVGHTISVHVSNGRDRPTKVRRLLLTGIASTLPRVRVIQWVEQTTVRPVNDESSALNPHVSDLLAMSSDEHVRYSISIDVAHAGNRTAEKCIRLGRWMLQRSRLIGLRRSGSCCPHSQSDDYSDDALPGSPIPRAASHHAPLLYRPNPHDRLVKQLDQVIKLRSSSLAA